MGLVVLLFAMFASIFTVAKVALVHTTPLFLVGSRMSVAGLLLVLYFLLSGRAREVKEARPHLIWFTLLGIFAIYITNALEFWGLQYLSAAKTCFIYSLSPFLAAIFSYFVFGEIPTRKKWLGLVIGFVGFLPIFLGQSESELALDSLGFLSLAELALLGATAASVYGWILMRKLVKEGHSPMLVNGISMFVGGILATIHSSFVDDWSPLPVTNWTVFAWTMVYLIVISSFICYNLYGYLLQRYTATFMAFAGFTTPFFTAFIGWIFLGETVSLEFWGSASIVLIGLGLFYHEELQEHGIHVESGEI